MASQFNQFDWYWDVLNTNHGTHVYSSRVGNFILVSDATYTAWLAADGGNLPTIIDTFASLCGVLNQFAKLNYVAAATSYTVTANITLPNPLANFIDFTNNTSTIFKLILPAANSTIGVPVGVPVTFRNLSTGGGAAACTIYLNDGTTLLAQVDPGTATTILLKNNNSYNGVWDARNAGNVNNSGTPTAGQYAKWVNALTIQGVSAATALGDIGAQPLDGDLTSLAAAAGTNTIYYRSGTDTWSPVVVSTGLAFSGGNLTATAGGGNVSNSGTPAANDVAQWVTSTTIKGVSLATWRTTPTFYNILNVLSAAGGDGAYLRGLSGQGWVYAEGASADISLVLSSKGNGVITFYNGNFTRICAQFTSASGSNTFPTFTGQLNYSTLGNNPTTNPIIMTSELRLLGVTSGASAAAGVVGEEIIFRRDFSTRLGLATSAYNIVGSIALTAGEWELSYSSGYHAEAAPVANGVQSSLSISSTTPVGDADGGIGGPLFAGGSIYAAGSISMNCPEYTVRLTSARTYYLLMWHNLGGAVPTYGTCYIRARRVR